MISFEGKTIEQVLDEIAQRVQQLSPEEHEKFVKGLSDWLGSPPLPPPPTPR